jgi:hypothetical protein
MTLLEKFIATEHPSTDPKDISINEYAAWLESLCYKLIQERKDAEEKLADTIPHLFLCDKCAEKYLDQRGDAEDLCISTFVARVCNRCEKIVRPEEKHHFFRKTKELHGGGSSTG